MNFFSTAVWLHRMDAIEGTSIKAIGLRLELTRTVFRMGQAEFCTRAKIATNTYNQYERGKKRPAIENAIALCEVYDLTLDWIYRGDPSGLRYNIADAIKLEKLRIQQARNRK